MLYTDIPDKFPIRFAENAMAPTYIRPIPEAAGTPTPTDAPASLDQGFPPETFTPVSGGGVPPAGADVNGILNQITAWCQWQAAGNATLFDAGFAADIGGYPKYALIASTTPGILWQSTADSNSTDPDGGSPANWISVGASQASVPQIQAGAATGVYISPGNLATAMGSAAGESILLPNGRIIKVNSYFTSLAAGVVFPLTFAVPFPTACIVPLPIGINATGSSARDLWLQVVSWDRFGFSVAVQDSNTGGAHTLDGIAWEAHGY